MHVLGESNFTEQSSNEHMTELKIHNDLMSEWKHKVL